MSTFDGVIKEYPLISVDRFLERKNYASTIYFLSHCHSDHMYGLSDENFFYLLESRGFSKIYVSDVSYHLLNNDGRYRHLSDYLVKLPLEAPTLIDVYDTEGREVLKVTVTLLTAGHCPGSVMFFFEGVNGNVLYTGDFRLPVGSAKRLIHLHATENSLKPLKSLYIDTTFCKEKCLFIPSREECLNKILKIVEPWLSKGPNYIVYILCPYALAYEFVFVELWKRFGLKTHVKSEWEKKYKGIKSLEDAITSSAANARIHACLVGNESRLPDCIKNSYRERTPCGFSSSDGNMVHVIKIRPCAMFFTNKNALDISDKIKKHNFYRVYYSTHPSLSEIRDMVHYLKPLQVFPNVVQHQTEEEILDLIFLAHQSKTTESDKENSDISSLGKLKSPSVEDGPSEENLSLPFFDEDYALKPCKKNGTNSSVKSHESRIKVDICIDTDFDNTEEQETMLREEIYSQKVEAGNGYACNKSPLKWQNPIESSDEELFDSSCDGLSGENHVKGGSDIIFGTPEEERVKHFDDEKEENAVALTPVNDSVRSSASESLIDEQYLCNIKCNNNWMMSEKRKNQIDIEYFKICEVDNALQKYKIDVEKDKTEHFKSSCSAFEQKKEFCEDNKSVVSNRNVYHLQPKYSVKVDQQSEIKKLEYLRIKENGSIDAYNISHQIKNSNCDKTLPSKSSSFESSNLSKMDDKSYEKKIEKSKTEYSYNFSGVSENCKNNNSKSSTSLFSDNVTCPIKNPEFSEPNNLVEICEIEPVKNKIEDFNRFYGMNKLKKGVSNNNACHSKFESSEEVENGNEIKIDAKSLSLPTTEITNKKDPNSFMFMNGRAVHFSKCDEVNLNKKDLETNVSQGYHNTDTCIRQEDKIINEKLPFDSHKKSDALIKSPVNKTSGSHIKNRHKKSKSFHFVKKIHSSSSESEDEYTFKYVIKIPEKDKMKNLCKAKNFKPQDHKSVSLDNSNDQSQEYQLKDNLYTKSNSKMKSVSDTKIASIESGQFITNKPSSDIAFNELSSDLNKKNENIFGSVSNKDSFSERTNSNLSKNSALQIGQQNNSALNNKSLSDFYVCKAASSHNVSSSYKKFTRFPSNVEEKTLKTIYSSERNADLFQQHSLDEADFRSAHERALLKLSDSGNDEVGVVNLEATSSCKSSGVKSFSSVAVQTEVVPSSQYKREESEVRYAAVNSDLYCTSNKQNFSLYTVSKTDTNDKNNSKKFHSDSAVKEDAAQLCNACCQSFNWDKFPEINSDNKINNQFNSLPNSSQCKSSENKNAQGNKSASQSSSDSSVIIEDIYPKSSGKSLVKNDQVNSLSNLSDYKTFENKNALDNKSSSQSSSDSSIIVEDIYLSTNVILGSRNHTNDISSLYQNGTSENNKAAWEIKSVSQSGSDIIVEEINSSSDIDDSPSLIAPIVPKTSLDVGSSFNSFAVSKRRKIDFSEVGSSNRTEDCDKVCDNYVIDSDSTPELFENLFSHSGIAVKKPIPEIIIDDDW